MRLGRWRAENEQLAASCDIFLMNSVPGPGEAE